MYFKLGVYRILERDIKYIRWVKQPKGDDWAATICFRDGEELTIFDIDDAEKSKIEDYLDRDIKRCTSYLYNTNTEEEEK